MINKDNLTHYVFQQSVQVLFVLIKGQLLNYVECGKVLLWKQL